MTKDGRATRQRERRLFRMDFRDRVSGVWDENVPIVRQWILEGVNIHPSVLNDEQFLLQAGDKLCAVLQLNVIDRYIKRFEPQGLTVVFLLSESHLAMHSWPERNYLHIDLVTCKKSKVDIGILCDEFEAQFRPSHARGYSVKY